MGRKELQVEHRDFVTEVRGMKDVEGLLDSCTVLLDVQEKPNENPATSSLETLIDALLQDMITGEGASRQREELKSLIFSNSERSSFSETVQGSVEAGGVDQAWLCSATSVPTLTERKVGMVRLARPTNMGGGALEVTLFLLVLAPETIKGTKTALETARTFATLLCQPSLRRHLHDAVSVDGFRQQIKKAATEEGEMKEKKEVALNKEGDNEDLKFWQAGAGIRQDLARRIPFYWSDYKDGVVGPKSLQKTLSTTFFLYFSIILPAIAFGNLVLHGPEHLRGNGQQPGESSQEGECLPLGPRGCCVDQRRPLHLRSSFHARGPAPFSSARAVPCGQGDQGRGWLRQRRGDLRQGD